MRGEERGALSFQNEDPTQDGWDKYFVSIVSAISPSSAGALRFRSSWATTHPATLSLFRTITKEAFAQRLALR